MTMRGASRGGVLPGAALGVEQAGLVRGDDELDPVPGAQLGQQMGHALTPLAEARPPAAAAPG
jgi:hypothetical protein